MAYTFVHKKALCFPFSRGYGLVENGRSRHAKVGTERQEALFLALVLASTRHRRASSCRSLDTKKPLVCLRPVKRQPRRPTDPQ
jgi:hypothetical protein